MAKFRFTADIGNGKTVLRTSLSKIYTHAVIVGDRSYSWHTTHELALRGLAQANRWSGGKARIVEVQGEEIVPKRTSQADRNAARRAVLTRQIKAWQRSLEWMRGYDNGALCETGQRRIAELEQERAALLAAKAEG